MCSQGWWKAGLLRAFRMLRVKFLRSSQIVETAIYQVEKDKRIDLGRLAKGAGKTEVRSIDYSGYVRRKYVSTADRGTENSDGNSLRHNAPGLVSMVKGGGSFEFVITPSPTPDPTLDDDHIVIGQVRALANSPWYDPTGRVSQSAIRNRPLDLSSYHRF
mmetsp:Transcript_7147/g.31588  ORF Transcript_7147/g.31588 Transcript_7147/m.31588 type:complete len:160 (+) Transcript_7147:414-893(+)